MLLLVSASIKYIPFSKPDRSSVLFAGFISRPYSGRINRTDNLTLKKIQWVIVGYTLPDQFVTCKFGSRTHANICPVVENEVLYVLYSV
jgi:hypothetical protein